MSTTVILKQNKKIQQHKQKQKQKRQNKRTNKQAIQQTNKQTNKRKTHWNYTPTSECSHQNSNTNSSIKKPFSYL